MYSLLYAWINLNLDNPKALSQISIPQTYLERVLEIKPDYLYGLPYVLMGVVHSARPPMFGGDVKQAEGHFEKALQLGKRNFFLTHYYYAKYLAVRNQNKELFFRLLNEVTNQEPSALEDVCLINIVMQNNAGQLLKKADEGECGTEYAEKAVFEKKSDEKKCGQNN